ncbi:MAG: hypothetical protein AAGM04_06615 [Pseudomonadota bacterium]
MVSNSNGAAASRRGVPGLVVPLLLISAVVAVAVYLIITAKPSLDRSIIGFQGFAVAAQKAGLDIVTHSGGSSLDSRAFGLRILPLYDGNFASTDRQNEGDTDGVLREMPRWAFQSKVRTVPTLVVLPKWTRGAWEREILHEDFFLPTNALGVPMNLRGAQFRGSVVRGEPRFVSGASQPLNSQSGDVLLQGFPAFDLAVYAPQTVRMSTINTGNTRCVTLIAWDNRPLLLRCGERRSGEPRARRKRNEVGFYLLTDPDVMNNHGAGHAQNFAFSLALVKALSGEKPVVMDFSTTIDRARNRNSGGRQFSDLAQFFMPPFTLFWLAFLLLAIFTLWRSGIRQSPIRNREDVRTIAASRLSMVDGEAAIFRPAGSPQNDGRISERYIANRIAALEDHILGRIDGPADQRGAALLRVLDARNPDLGERLTNLRRMRFGDSARGRDRTIIAALQDLETLETEIKDEFRRPAKPRR